MAVRGKRRRAGQRGHVAAGGDGERGEVAKREEVRVWAWIRQS